VAFGLVDGTPVLFVGLERSNAVMTYDVSNPAAPVLLDVINVNASSGLGATAPEGLQFIPAGDNATGRPLLAVCSEGNGTLSVFAINDGVAVATTFGSGCPAVQPLTLGSNLPQLASTWTLSASNVNLAAPFCTFWFGGSALSNPIELTAINAAGCFAHIDISLGAFLAPAAGGTSSYQVAVPASPSLLAYALTAQASTFDGAVFASSNGLAAVVGN
jgi:hypothetical protein